MTALSVALVLLGAIAWDAWRRYLIAIDRTAGLKALEQSLTARIKALEQVQAQQQRAIGIRAMAQAKVATDAA